MDTTNWSPTGPAGEPAMDTGDWRNQLQPDSRQRIVNKIMETLKRHLPVSGQDGLQELKKIAVRFEEKIYTAATSQSDYLRKISLKTLTMETRSKNTVPNSLPSNKPPVPGASQGMQSQVPNQVQSLPMPISAHQSQTRQQLMAQNMQNNAVSNGVQSTADLHSATLPVSGLTQTPISNNIGRHLGLQCLTNMLVTMGWILVTGVFILSGIFLFFHNGLADTWVAVDDFLQHPAANSALDLQFLPCVSNERVQSALNTNKMTTKSLIAMDNQYIKNIANNNNLTPDAGSFYYNQSGPPVPLLCDPYNDDLTDRKCGSDEVDFTTVAQEWEKYICEISAEGICTSIGRLTPNIYNQLTVAVNISSSLQQKGIFLANLADCSFVLDTFRDIKSLSKSEDI
ncbi:hypothetical protein Tsubulata_034579 [Turnera subulata]|uniref:Mediator complex subunit 15 KIX domain-containing protein n=1 Tax=Turnera subulata TaxID=218843 RepID=A0A9Q0J6T1_9ROSI|nr:hypothetical protein Tsubulata_034579 [Turnera subulata]